MNKSYQNSILAGLGLTLFQLLLALIINGGHFASLTHWDSAWYAEIASRGYPPAPHKILPGDQSFISFFPAFPIWIRGVLSLVPLAPKTAGAIAAQIACVGVWTYLLLLGHFLKLRREAILALILIFLLQPGGFYLVTGYSESLFTAAILGFIYWTIQAFSKPQNQKKTWIYALAAIFHGGVLGATRWVGVPLLAFPLLLDLLQKHSCHPRSKFPRYPLPRLGLALSLGSLWGFLAFLGFCQYRYNQWNIYWEANRLGWAVYLDPWKLFTWSYYRDVFFFGNLPEMTGRVLTIFTLIFLGRAFRAIWKTSQRSPVRQALWTLCFLFLAETMIGSHGLHSMIRYLIPIFGIGLPVLIAQKQEETFSQSFPLVFALSLILMLTLQYVFLARFSVGAWVS